MTYIDIHKVHILRTVNCLVFGVERSLFITIVLINTIN